MVHVHIDGTPSEVRTQMQELLHGHADQVVTIQSSVALPKKEKKTTEAPAETKSVTATETVAASKVVFQDIKDIIPKIMEKLGKPGIVDLLSTFGAKKGSELKEEDYSKFMDVAQKLLA
jgi:ABC-type phosphate/phosphonate transport system substrate-binding protein